jgi:hypothetical protein
MAIRKTAESKSSTIVANPVRNSVATRLYVDALRRLGADNETVAAVEGKQHPRSRFRSRLTQILDKGTHDTNL